METDNNPHHAQISFTINIFPFSPDGSLIPNKITDLELQELGITSTAVFNISGFNKKDCINKIKEVLSKLKYEE